MIWHAQEMKKDLMIVLIQHGDIIIAILTPNVWPYSAKQVDLHLLNHKK
jgi:hypothetical protein